MNIETLDKALNAKRKVDDLQLILEGLSAKDIDKAKQAIRDMLRLDNEELLINVFETCKKYCVAEYTKAHKEFTEI